MIVTAGKPFFFFLRKRGELFQAVFTDKNDNETTYSGRRLGDGVEFAIPSEKITNVYLPATVSFKVDNVEIESTSLELNPTLSDIDAAVAEAVEAHTPGIELGYAERFTTHTHTVNEDIPALSVTVVGKGRPVLVRFFCSSAYHSVLTTLVRADLKQDGVIIESGQDIASSVSTGRDINVARRTGILTDGVSYTFTVRGFRGAAGTTTWYADATRPMWLSVVGL